ncbi:MAG: hypothetical protein CSA65_08470 [Proteobacteria bacterium]|nr:MAG: hypothetical protein CSA65_08470 [Pseudomonadota bacterium]
MTGDLIATAAIELRAVSFSYAEELVLRDLDLEISAGARLALLGGSGSGKSTLLRLILGLEVPDAGGVMIAGQHASVAGRCLVSPERRGLAVVFQELGLWPHLSVRDNVGFGLRARCGRAERLARSSALLERVGLAALADRLPGTLSGGERQRVAIARALAPRPHAVLLDEPLANLDVALRRELLASFDELLSGERGTTVLYVTHDPREAELLGAEVAVLADGRVQQRGAVEALRERPANDTVAQLVRPL